MAKAEWGTKRICPTCGTRYYDLLREPVICPKCDTPYDPEAFLKSRRARPAAPVEKELEPVRAEELDADLETEEADVAEEEEEAVPLEEAEEEDDLHHHHRPRWSRQARPISAALSGQRICRLVRIVCM